MNVGVDTIADDQGNRTNPSTLSGREVADVTVQADIKLWPFKVISGPGDTPIVQVNASGAEETFHSEVICFMVRFS